MSATSELLAEQVRLLNAQIEEALARGEDVTELVVQLNAASLRLHRANEALNEGKQRILKG